MQAAPQEHHLEEEEEEAPQEHHLEEEEEAPQEHHLEEEEAPQEQYLEEEKEEEEPQLLRPCKKQQRWPCPVAMLLLSLQALTHKTQRWWLCNRIVVALLMVSAWQNLGVLVVCMQLMIIAIDDFPVQV